MFHKDTFRLIRKTRKRFVTIVLIVLIGVAFMVGLMSSSPTMLSSVDKYFDETDFMDIQLYSSYGFDDRDVKALEKAEQIEKVYPTRFVDAYAKYGDRSVVTRVQEARSDINRLELVEGRMPYGPDEAVALGSSSFGSVYSIGDTVSLYLNDSDISENLAHTEYKIVGIVRTPQYMASSKETSTLDNLGLDTVIFVNDSSFVADYYTSIYLLLKDTQPLESFTDEYREFVSDTMDDLSGIIKKQQVVRRDETIAEVTQQIEDGEREMEEEISKAQKEIDEGKQKLEDAYIQILVGEAQIESSLKQLREGEKRLVEGEKQLAEGEKQLTDGKKLLEDQTGMSFSDASTTIKTVYNIYTILDVLIVENGDVTVQKALDDKKASREEIKEENDILAADIAALTEENTRLEGDILTLEAANTALESENNLLEEQNRQLEEENRSDLIIANKAKIAGNKITIEANNIEITKKQAEIKINQSKIEDYTEKINQNTEELSQLNEDIIKLEVVNSVIGNKTIKELPDIINGMFGGDIKTAYEGVLRIEAAEVEIAAGKKEMRSARLEVELGKQQIEEAEKQLASGRAEYEKGKKQLEEGQAELDEKAEEARIELAKARQQLAELPDAQWTVLDRDMHYSTYMFYNNAIQMKKIGSVFPMLFFLVAALVCMTTMKRLVDEERSQMGVFSALGFSKNKIISKYVIYAFTASMIGSLVAIPIGMALFPTVVYFCWKLMYDLPDMLLTMPASIAVLGVCSFTLLMILVTYLVARGVLKDNPSSLMRPKAPKKATKVFIEYIPFIWKRFSFTSKVTARNIIRYKSRFFMTVIGVAGCTSLLVLGFALKGSISQVVSLQYGGIITHDTVMTLEDSDNLPAITKKLENDDNILEAVPYMAYSSMVYLDGEEKTIQIYVMEEDTVENAFDLRRRKTKEPLSVRKGAVISEKFAKMYNISAGDEITVESFNGIKQKVEIEAICEMYTQHYLFISQEMYEDIFAESVTYENIALTTQDSQAAIKRYEETEGVQSVADFSAMKATFDNMFDSLDIIIIVIILAAGSLALVVITNLTEVNISERIREIATLKVLGFNNGEVYSYIFKEVFILSLLGMLVGLPFGRFELMFVMGIIDMEMIMFPTTVALTDYLFGFVITLVFTILVILLMRKNLRNVQMVESLKSVE